MNFSSHQFSPRRAHRKRISTSRLSTDTVTTLPEYTSPPWHRKIQSIEDPPSDQPPDYPDSAEEGDADTEDEDEDENTLTVYVPPQPSLPASPRRHVARRFPSHRRQTASTSQIDPYLDSLLERSVHALEMSNTLLQSSQATQSSLSVLLSPDSPADRTLEVSARGLSSRIRGNRDMHESWMDDLDEITRGVEGLFGDDKEGSAVEASVSRSLPTCHMPTQIRGQNRRRPSLELRKTTSEDAPSLRLSNLRRSELISPPPRALTQYVESSADPESIFLPSTLGLRASSSSHSSETWQSPEPSASTTDLRIGLHASPSLPVLTDRPSDPSTPAYALLSSFVARAPSSGSSTPSSSMTSRASFGRNRRGSNCTERCSNHTQSPKPRIAQMSPDRNILGRRNSASRSRSVTPKRPNSPPPHPRPMTPPIEELSASSSSSSSDAKPTGYRTVQSLRKILDEQPPPAEDPAKNPARPRAPAFLPRTPAPAPTSDTSTATASISRLFTKGTHSSSTRPPSPPRHSSMKQRSAPTTPSHTPSPSTLSIPDVFGLGSGQSSGRSTPKRISFAELPESYAGSRPGSRFKEKKGKSRKRDKAANGRTAKDQDELGDGTGWWTGWLLGTTGSGLTLSAQRHEERLEERIASRGWGGRSGMSGGLDDWAI